MSGFLKSYGMEDEELESLVLTSKKNEMDLRNEDTLKNLLRSKKVYIFGAGQYGRRMLYELQVRGIKVDGFLDNNATWEGQQVEKILCYLPDKELKSNDDAAVIVAVRNCRTILNQLDELGVRDVLLKRDIEKVLYKGELADA